MDGDDPSGTTRRIGPYRLEERLGAGGMGEVYRAWDERLKRRVALKQIRSGVAESSRPRRRFRREARAAARLHHPGIVKVYDVLVEEDGDWIVMECVEGKTLRELLSSGPLPPADAVELAVELATALAAAHAEGIVHRDLKAQNVIVTPAGHAKILDFGLAKRVTPDHERGSSTWASGSISIDGQLLGTPHAMSPEQVAGREVDPRSDLFAFGVLLYEMLAGISPFRGPNLGETVMKICTHRQAPLTELVPRVAPALSDLVDRLLEKDPAHRPRSAGEVILGLWMVEDRPSAETTTPAVSALAEDVTLDGGDSSSRDETLTREARPAGVARPPTAERRQVTVMCCEIVGASESSGPLDPEAVYGVMDGFEGLVRELARRIEGHVANVLGHRTVVVSGYPRTHEDDAARAVRAARELVARFEEVSAEPAEVDRPRLAVRVGLHTGPAMVLGRQGQLALGPTLDEALALQRRAGPDSVLVSAATRRLIEPYQE